MVTGKEEDPPGGRGWTMLRRVVLQREYPEKNISAAGDRDQGAGGQDPESWILMDDPKAGRPAAELTMRAGVDLTDGQFFICDG